jgi:superfamily II DNA or RNA helicase
VLSERQWQRDAFLRWLAQGKRGIVSVVTGGGKTYFALRCIQYYRQHEPLPTVVIVVPTTALLEQWSDEVLSYFNVPLSHINHVSSKSGIKQSKINIGVVNTVAKLASTGEAKFPVMLVVDECHRAASPSFKSIFDLNSIATLGLSATPERQYDDGLSQILIPGLGPILMTYDYTQALAEGVIVPFSLVNIVYEMEADEKTEYEKLTKAIRIAIEKEGLESSKAVSLMLKRTRILNMSLRRIELTLKIVARNRNRRIIIFHEDVNACNLIHKVLLEQGVKASLYHSSLPTSQRLRYLDDYKSGVNDVLVTCRALDEGLNVPDTEVGIVAASTATYRQRIQRLGRILRPSADKSMATVYTIVASNPEMKRLAQEAQSLSEIVDVEWERV